MDPQKSASGQQQPRQKPDYDIRNGGHYGTCPFSLLEVAGRSRDDGPPARPRALVVLLGASKLRPASDQCRAMLIRGVSNQAPVLQ